MQVGQWEGGDGRDTRLAVRVPGAQPESQTPSPPLSGVKPSASSATASKMHSSGLLVDTARVSSE